MVLKSIPQSKNLEVQFVPLESNLSSSQVRFLSFENFIDEANLDGLDAGNVSSTYHNGNDTA